MTDEVVKNKLASIQRCISRVRDEYQEGGDGFLGNFSRKDAAILNIQRACEASIDLANYLIRKYHWEFPTTSRESFIRLFQHGVLDQALSVALQKMVGFRNIAVHDYASLHDGVLVMIIEQRLVDFESFAKAIVLYEER